MIEAPPGGFVKSKYEFVQWIHKLPYFWMQNLAYYVFGKRKPEYQTEILWKLSGLASKGRVTKWREVHIDCLQNGSFIHVELWVDGKIVSVFPGCWYLYVNNGDRVVFNLDNQVVKVITQNIRGPKV
jgi:hypothetical protein